MYMKYKIKRQIMSKSSGLIINILCISFIYIGYKEKYITNLLMNSIRVLYSISELAELY